MQTQLGIWRQVELQGSVSSQPSLFGELQTNKRPCLKNREDNILGKTAEHLRTLEHIHTCTRTVFWISDRED